MRGVGAVLMVLQDGAREPLLAAGDDYVLVLRGSPLQIVCPQRTVAAVDSEQEPARVEILTQENNYFGREKRCLRSKPRLGRPISSN